LFKQKKKKKKKEEEKEDKFSLPHHFNQRCPFSFSYSLFSVLVLCCIFAKKKQKSWDSQFVPLAL